MTFRRRMGLSAGFVAVAAAHNQHHLAFVATSRGIASKSFSPSARVGSRCSASYSPRPMSQSLSSASDDDVFLLSVDGTLASASRSRAWMAVCAALRVWPTLRSNMEALGMDPDVFDRDGGAICSEVDDSHEWLLRKLAALSSITQQGDSPDFMLGCEAVFLARLVMEEQLLDAGRSNGRGGKYGGKFHPSSTTSDGNENRPKVGSRPLTVGELYANWPELRDVARMKYPFVEEDPNGKTNKGDPLPIVRQCMKELYSAAENDSVNGNIQPSWQSHAYDILFDGSGISSSSDEGINLRQNTMLLLGHDAQIPMVLKSLTSFGYDLNVKSDIEITHCGEASKAFCIKSNAETTSRNNMKVIITTSDKAIDQLIHQGLLLVVPDTKKDETHSGMIEQIVSDFDNNTEPDSKKNIIVIHSSLDVLKQCKSFLGDDPPMLSQGIRKCVLPRSKSAVNLFLPGWADNVHPTQQNDGEMDPWLNVMSDEQLLELVSAELAVAWS